MLAGWKDSIVVATMIVMMAARRDLRRAAVKVDTMVE